MVDSAVVVMHGEGMQDILFLEAGHGQRLGCKMRVPCLGMTIDGVGDE